MRHLLTASVIAALLCGCGSSSGDVETAHKAALAAPKSVDELPADMPAEAKASAAGAMGAAQATQADAQNAARLKAMEEMAKQRR